MTETDSKAGTDTGQETFVEATELHVTIKQQLKCHVKRNPKLAVFREFVLATVFSQAREHQQRLSATVVKTRDGEAVRQFYACDLVAQSGLAGLQWKKHLGADVSVTVAVAELRETEQVQSNIRENGLSPVDLPLHPDLAAGSHLPPQSTSEVHVAQCDAGVLMLLEAFDFVYLDPHKSPSPYFSTLFRSVRNDGVVCIVIPDTMHFARAPHVVRRCYGASCIKTEYLKELAVRIVVSSLASEAAKCNKGLTVLYAVSLEDFLLLCVQVKRGPKLADAALLNIGQVLHCRICEERAFYPDLLAPQDAYKLLGCKCQENVPGKTAVVLGPLWKGSLFSWHCLRNVAIAGQTLNLSHEFFSLLQRVMEDCLCDTPPTLSQLKNTVSTASEKEKCAISQVQPTSGDETLKVSSPDVGNTCVTLPSHEERQPKCGSCNAVLCGQDACSCNQSASVAVVAETAVKTNGQQECESGSKEDQIQASAEIQKPKTVNLLEHGASIVDSTSDCMHAGVNDGNNTSSGDHDCGLLSTPCSVGSNSTTQDSFMQNKSSKRSRSDSAFDIGDGQTAEISCKRLKMDEEPSPAPCFYYSVHSKRLGKGHLPKQSAIIECLRSHGFRCCRAHFDKYAIRTDAKFDTLTTFLGSGESKLVYVKGLESSR